MLLQAHTSPISRRTTKAKKGFIRSLGKVDLHLTTPKYLEFDNAADLGFFGKELSERISLAGTRLIASFSIKGIPASELKHILSMFQPSQYSNETRNYQLIVYMDPRERKWWIWEGETIETPIGPVVYDDESLKNWEKWDGKTSTIFLIYRPDMYYLEEFNVWETNPVSFILSQLRTQIEFIEKVKKDPRLKRFFHIKDSALNEILEVFKKYHDIIWRDQKVSLEEYRTVLGTAYLHFPHTLSIPRWIDQLSSLLEYDEELKKKGQEWALIVNYTGLHAIGNIKRVRNSREKLSIF